jgi:hypothetical protein
VRAVLEGIAFGLRDSLDLIAELGPLPDRGRVSGGGARSEEWLKIVASVLELPLERTAADEGAAFGAALLGGVAGGLWASAAEAAEAVVQPTSTVEPSRTGSSATPRAVRRSARSTRRSATWSRRRTDRPELLRGGDRVAQHARTTPHAPGAGRSPSEGDATRAAARPGWVGGIPGARLAPGPDQMRFLYKSALPQYVDRPSVLGKAMSVK